MACNPVPESVLACGSLLPPGTAVRDSQPSTSEVGADIDKDLKRFANQTAATFAPRSSTASKNPAVKGSVLYNIFEVQAKKG